MQNTPHFYRTKKWKDLRSETLLRDNFICQYCGDPAPMADHVIPRRRKGPDHIDNLVACCPECNRVAGNTLFRSFADKKSWIRRHRMITPPLPREKTKDRGIQPKKLTGWKKKLHERHHN